MKRYIFLHLCSLKPTLQGKTWKQGSDNTDNRKPTSNMWRSSATIVSGKIQEVLSGNVLAVRRPRKQSKALPPPVWPSWASYLLPLGRILYLQDCGGDRHHHHRHLPGFRLTERITDTEMLHQQLRITTNIKWYYYYYSKEEWLNATKFILLLLSSKNQTTE